MKNTDKVTLTIGQLKRLIKESSNEDFNASNPDEFIDFIKSLPDSDSFLWYYEDTGNWIMTTEWLCGTFAGRAFECPTLQEAAKKMINYLNKHIGHGSMVGREVTKSGWPNKRSVEAYLEYRNNLETLAGR